MTCWMCMWTGAPFSGTGKRLTLDEEKIRYHAQKAFDAIRP